MIKKVNVDDLKPGAFVCDFKRPWRHRPFMFKTRLIKDEWDIERIRKYGITHVMIDTSKGINITPKPVTFEDWNKAFGSNEQILEKLALERSPWVPFEKEIVKAREIKAKARIFVEELTRNVAAGKTFDVNKASEIVDEMVSSLARNRDALVSLISLQDKDEYTFNHSINVSVMMASFCKYLGMDADEMRVYATGALFHDLGKTKVPIEVINKPGRFDPDELELMRRHPEYGKELLDGVEGIQPEMIDIVYEHHERMDGSGYPNKLEGHDISLGGRIAAIVDVYDALTSDRPYKTGDSPTDVLRYLFECSPKQYDLELLQKFIQSVGIYPVGTLVRLSTGFLAVVAESARENLLKPIVTLVYDINKQRTIPARKLDLSKGVGELHTIVSAESAAKWKLDVGALLHMH